MYKSKLTIEIEVETQFGPEDAAGMVAALLRVPAIKTVLLTNLETDYKLLTAQDHNQHYMKEFPIKLN